ncbi:hypothetical protein BYT27DRAFT_7178887 [Phlegmacium glaucopus]|nr:hypothetical protein BYT27DRAFT_7178887 [Phlegmacium glaucopus]
MTFHIFRRIFHLIGNLKLASTWRGLKYCPHPWLTLWKLLWPLPWRYRLPIPLDPLEIRDHPDIVHQRYYVEENYRRLRSFPLFQLRDTSLRSLYRLHDALCADQQNYVMLESDYFWRRARWRIKDIPDPKDPNPLRYAILASLVESMVEAYNWKITLGLRRGVGVTSKEQDEAFRRDPNKPFEEVPSWASLVHPLEEWTSFLEDRAIHNYAAPFYKRRISANPLQLENI